MRNLRSPRLIVLVVCLCWITGPALAQESATPVKTASTRISTREEIADEFKAVPCKNADRLTAVKAFFERMGAKPEEISAEKISGGNNLVIIIPASSTESGAEKIVIGAHFDKTPDGCGALDNWSGITALAHVYRTAKEMKFKKTIIFVAFGEEEKGLVGSVGMVEKIKKEELPEYCAMINIDSLGLAYPQAADNMSSKKMMDFTAELAGKMNLPFAHAAIPGAGADSQPFLSKKIPAITLHGMTNDWPKYLHSSGDKPENVKTESVYLGYRLTLALLVEVDGSPCQAFKEQKESKDSKATKEKK